MVEPIVSLNSLSRALSLTQMLTHISANLGPFALTDFGFNRLGKNLIGLLCRVLPCLSAKSQLASLTWLRSSSLAPRLIKLLSSSEDISTHSFRKRSPVKSCFLFEDWPGLGGDLGKNYISPTAFC